MYNSNDILNNFKKLPAMPNVITHALGIIKDPESSIKELAKIVSYDQALSTQVLTLVNSAYYGFAQQVTSITRAISLIGMSKAKNIIMTVAMQPMLTNQGDKDLWKHSLTTAVGCEYLAQRLKIMDADEAFVVGFLHDLGKIILKLQDTRLYEKVKETSKLNPNILEVEKMYYGTDHCIMGSLLAKKWQLPLLVANTVKYHHMPNLSSMPTVCSLVYFVDALVQENFDYANLDKDAMNNLNLHIDQPQILQEQILEKAQLLLNELST